MFHYLFTSVQEGWFHKINILKVKLVQLPVCLLAPPHFCWLYSANQSFSLPDAWHPSAHLDVREILKGKGARARSTLCTFSFFFASFYWKFFQQGSLSVRGCPAWSHWGQSHWYRSRASITVSARPRLQSAPGSSVPTCTRPSWSFWSSNADLAMLT